MKIEIVDVENSLDAHFGYWLIRQIKVLFIQRVDVKKLDVWNKFLSEQDHYKTLDCSAVSCYSILIQGIESLVVDKVPQKVIIRFNNNKFVKNMNRVKLDVLCRTINFGTTTFRGYPILTEVFSEVVDNINTYVERYFDGG